MLEHHNLAYITLVIHSDFMFCEKLSHVHAILIRHHHLFLQKPKYARMHIKSYLTYGAFALKSQVKFESAFLEFLKIFRGC